MAIPSEYYHRISFNYSIDDAEFLIRLVPGGDIIGKARQLDFNRKWVIRAINDKGFFSSNGKYYDFLDDAIRDYVKDDLLF